MLLAVSDSARGGCSSGALHDVALARQLQRMGTGVVVLSLEPDLVLDDDAVADHETVDGLDFVAVERAEEGLLDQAVEWIAEEWPVHAVVVLCELERAELGELASTARRCGLPFVALVPPTATPDAFGPLLGSTERVLVWSNRLKAAVEDCGAGDARIEVVPPGADPAWADWMPRVDVAMPGRIKALDDGGFMAAGLQEQLRGAGVELVSLGTFDELKSLFDECDVLLMLSTTVTAFHVAQLAQLAGVGVVMPAADGLPERSADGSPLRTFALGDWGNAIDLAREAAAQSSRAPLPPRIEEEAFMLEKALDGLRRRS